MDNFSQVNFKHGCAKLQSASSSLLCLTSNDGGELLIYNTETKDYMPVPLGPGGINQELFNNSANVEDILNSSLKPNTLYSVYLNSDCTLRFYETFKRGNPTLDGYGIYIHPINKSVYVGQVYSGNNNISTIITPSIHMQQPCYSHFNPWLFGFQTTVLIGNKFTKSMNGVQQYPSLLTVTEGISECFKINGSLNFKGGFFGTISYCIEVNGTSIDGPWVSSSPKQTVSTKHFSWQLLTATWMSAPPIGVYTVKPVIEFTGFGKLEYKTHLLGELSL